jgi:ATP-dependent DNA helicase RecG
MFTKIELKKIDGKDIIHIEVLRGTKRPYHLTSKGMKPTGVFVRHGITSSPASEGLIRQMILENEGMTYEKMRSMNQELTFKYSEKYFADRNIVFENAQKRTLGLINEDDYFTNLGLLLSEQCDHSIKCAAYNGTTKMTFRDRMEFTGSVLEQLDRAYDYISIYNRTASTFEGLKRVDKTDYPEFAVREALINSIVHRDYSYSGSILIHIFDDRIEFVSTGGLVAGLTKEDIMAGVSESRNKNLSNCFYRLELIESYGTGIQRIIESYEEMINKPLINITANAFVVTLPNLNYVYKERTEKERIIDMFNENKSIKREDIENELGISKSSARLLLKELLDESKIRQIGKGKNTEYIKY